MRCVARASLLALVGCNQLFGITPTRPYDAAPDVVPDIPHVVLDWQNATLLTTGAPDPVIRFAPIDPPPRVRIAPLDGPFDVDQTTYSTSDGSIPIPRAYLHTTWRLEYTLADNIPHEVQWNPDDQQGHLTVPLFGRIQRDPLPIGSGYAITPKNPPGSYTSPRVFTTGLWTEGRATFSGPTVNYDFFNNNAVSLSGPKGRPDPALGDHALLIDYLTDGTGCRVAVGSAELASAAVEPGAHTPLTPMWDTSSELVMSVPVDGPSTTRLPMALGKLHSTLSLTLSTQLFGAAASIDMPGLAASPETSTLLGALLPVPVMQTLLQCPYNIPFPAAARPATLDPFPRILHVQIVDTRQALGVTLVSGMETVIPLVAGGFTMALPAAIPKQFTLTTPASVTYDLSGDTEQVTVAAPNAPLDLAFTYEMTAGLRADYFDVVLHRIDAGALTTERIYTVTTPRVRIDGGILTPGADYVFEVRSYKGHPQASHGDFAPVDYPYGAAIVFARTFRIAP